MITHRLLTEEDYLPLELTLALDIEHPYTSAEFFFNPRTICSVYEDLQGPVLYARGAKTLRLDLHYVNNLDAKRNMKVMLDGFPELLWNASQNGFSEVMFNSKSPLLRKFCMKRLGFVEAPNELRREI
jgi:hypothetical protein